MDGTVEFRTEAMIVERQGTIFTTHQTNHHHRLCLELDQSVTTATGLHNVSDAWEDLHYTYARI